MTAPLRSRQPLVITLGAMLSLLPAARAQVSFDISPYVGLFVPLRSMFVCGGYSCSWDGGTAPPPAPGQGVALQKTIAVGGHLTVWPARRWGIEATFGYAPSGVTIGCRVPACDAAHAVTASAKVVVSLTGVPSRRSFYLGGGVGLVALGGNAYIGVAGTTSVAGTVGAGVELWAASVARVRIDAEVYLFRPPFRSGSNPCDASDGICRVLPPNTGWTQQSQPAVILSIGWVFGRVSPARR